MSESFKLVFLVAFTLLMLSFICILIRRLFIISSENKILVNPETFIAAIDRAEAHENLRVWSKAVRCTLIQLGYDEKWINNNFRDMLEDFYNYE